MSNPSPPLKLLLEKICPTLVVISSGLTARFILCCGNSADCTVKTLLGPVAVKSTFDNDVWIYIERKTTASQIKTLGRKKLLTNNVLILEINSQGMLVKKDFLDLTKMNKLKISKSSTAVINNKNTFISTLLRVEFVLFQYWW